MAAISLFMNLFENCNNIICLESDVEHFSWKPNLNIIYYYGDKSILKF